MKQYDDDAEKYGYEGEMTTMKCDELQRYEVRADYDAGTIDVPCDNDKYGQYMLAEDVIEAIAELKEAWRCEHKSCVTLKAEIESLKASHYAEMVDAGMRERRLRRALWIARALRARDIQRWWISATCAPITERACSVWNNVERKCRAKAEEYK